MPERLRFLPAGSDSFLVELDDLETTLTLLDGLLGARPEGVRELVPAARTVMIRFDPLVTNRAALAAFVSRMDLSGRRVRQGETFDIPVTYDGEDLGDVAEFLGWSVTELIRRHTEATYTVAFTGFAPGFAYMTCDDPAFDVPRRKSPRMRIPAGSVAIAGKFGGIYPTDSPGGWQLLGTTPLRMWDTARARAALLAPGDRVRFRNIARGAAIPASVRMPQADTAPPAGAFASSAQTGRRSIRTSVVQGMQIRAFHSPVRSIAPHCARPISASAIRAWWPQLRSHSAVSRYGPTGLSRSP